MPGHLMCRTHWFLLPTKLRISILAAYHGHFWEDYRALVSRAIDIVDAMPGPFETRQQAELRLQMSTTTAYDEKGRAVRFEQGRLL